jgi:hypothetical protein
VPLNFSEKTTGIMIRSAVKYAAVYAALLYSSEEFFWTFSFEWS